MKPTRGYNSPGCHSTFATATRPTPALCLVAEARVAAPHVVGRTTDGSLQEGSDLGVQHLVRGEADRVLESLRLQVLVHVRQSEGRIATQQPPEVLAAIPRHHRSSTSRQPWALYTFPGR